ncbi:MAG: colanic acid biosynthesis protein, partial [Planctomycetaceae bacterium]|nr:colanic acid biosynthesis protein [Planctomycetaceae bacterium]
ASPDTGNRGVTALCHSVLWHLNSRDVEQITVFDHGLGLRNDTVDFGTKQIPIKLCGAVHSRRYYRPECLWNIRFSTWARGAFNPAAQAIRHADAVLDVSAGDSFTDLYGPHRFQTIVMPKMIALDAGRPLILLPQTYGPFRSDKARATASRIIRQSKMAWARDTDSFAALRELLGNYFDPLRHRCGVDMAFALPALMPRNLPRQLANWFSPLERNEHEVVGFNISGLIYNQPESAAAQFGLKANYPELVLSFLNWLLKTTSVRVVLIPHVMAPQGHPESDYDAACHVLAQLAPEYRDRVAICSPDYSPSELKWVIAQTQWFTGTRMHSTIAALSSGVPTASASYSLKTRGVYESCGHDHQVFELRHLETRQMLDAMQGSFLRREEDRLLLASRIPSVVQRARQQLDDIVDFVSEDAAYRKGA